MRQIVLLTALSLATLRAPAATSELDSALTYSRGQNGTAATSQMLRLTKDSLSKKSSALKNIGVDLSLTASQPDYSQTRLKKADGTEAPLTGTSKVELSSKVGATYAWTNTTVGAYWAGAVTASPYASQTVGVTLQQAFAERTTLATVTGDMGAANAPASYFADVETLQTRARPTFVHTNSVSGSVEQILSERYKAKVQLMTAQKVEERPRNYSALIGQRFAISDRLAAGLDLFALTENDNDTLRDDRGYFSIWSGTLSLTLEPVYDWLVAVTYSLALEEEADPRRTFLSRQGSDQYGLAVAYNARFGTVYAKGSYLVSALNTNEANVAGGIAWRL